MEMQLYALHVIPFVILVYLAFLLFIHPPAPVILASLLGGFTMALINALFDLLAYYIHLWHYDVTGLVLSLPIPLYITEWLVYGGIVYLLIWRFWNGRWHWLALLFLIGVPLFSFVRDLLSSGITHTTYLVWNTFLAAPVDFFLWLLMFYAGFFVFRQFAPSREREVKSV